MRMVKLLFCGLFARFSGEVKGIPRACQVGGVALAICTISFLSPAVLGTGQIRILAIGQVLPEECLFFGKPAMCGKNLLIESSDNAKRRG